MVKKIIFLNAALLFSLNALCADWQDDLAHVLGTSKRWDRAQIRAVITKHLKQDSATTKQLKNRVNSAPDGVRGKISKFADQSCLSSAESVCHEHEKIAHALDMLDRNQFERDTVLLHARRLYYDQQELNNLEHELESLKDDLRKAGKLQKLKVGGSLAGKELEIGKAKITIASDKKELERDLFALLKREDELKALRAEVSNKEQTLFRAQAVTHTHTNNRSRA